MSNDWDFYALRVDGEPASIYVDLGIEAEAPIRSLPHMAYVRLHMNQPRDDGLSSQEEFATLIEIENAIEAQLCSEDVAYVGRNTSGGCRDFYFYASTGEAWESKVDEVLAPFRSYRYQAATREDAAWSSYLNFLLPGDVDRQRIMNRRVCQALEQHGDKLTDPREMDHWLYFPSAEAVQAFLAEMAVDGYQLRGAPFDNEGPLGFGVQVWRVDTPSYGRIDDITQPLLAAASRHGGEYDGWECPVEA